MSNIIIGLTGNRQVGKSEIAKFLIRECGFITVHPFNGGKAACRALYEHYGASAEEAWEMTDGKLKDTPSEYLPGNVPSRVFMEDFGRFMGVDMGCEWTLGKEIDRALEKDPNARILAESIAYEGPMLREKGAKIFRIKRDRSVINGHNTDKAGALIGVDGTFLNNYDFLEDMKHDFLSFLASNGVDLSEEPAVNAMEEMTPM